MNVSQTFILKKLSCGPFSRWTFPESAQREDQMHSQPLHNVHPLAVKTDGWHNVSLKVKLKHLGYPDNLALFWYSLIQFHTHHWCVLCAGGLIYCSCYTDKQNEKPTVWDMVEKKARNGILHSWDWTANGYAEKQWITAKKMKQKYE